MSGALTGFTQQLPTGKRQRRFVLGPIVVLVVLAVFVLVVVGILADNLGGAAVVAGALLALLPVGPVVAVFLWIDRWEPEPPHLLLAAFGWGAGIAALIALLINSPVSALLDQQLGADQGNIVSVAVVAPVVEEAVKGAFVVGLLLFKRREFDGIVDGIVYAGLTAAGFAFTENILYIGTTLVEHHSGGDGPGVLTVVLLRCVISPFAHPLFTAMTGIAAGFAAHSPARSAWLLIPVGYLAAVVLHGLWNGSGATSGAVGFIWVYALVMLPVFACVLGLGIWQRRREQHTVIEQLPGFAQAGWIAHSEVVLLSSLAGRRGWRAAVRRRSGRKVERAVLRYQAAVTEMAFLQARTNRGAIGKLGARWREEALAELLSARIAAVGHPEALTVALRYEDPVSGAWSPPRPGPAPAPPSRYDPLPPDAPPQSWSPPDPRI